MLKATVVVVVGSLASVSSLLITPLRALDAEGLSIVVRGESGDICSVAPLPLFLATLFGTNLPSFLFGEAISPLHHWPGIHLCIWSTNSVTARKPLRLALCDSCPESCPDYLLSLIE